MSPILNLEIPCKINKSVAVFDGMSARGTHLVFGPGGEALS